MTSDGHFFDVFLNWVSNLVFYIWIHVIMIS
jgi:hypothetical protein